MELTALARNAEGVVRQLMSLDEVEQTRSDATTRVWVDLEAPRDEDLQRIARLFNLAPAAIEDCVQGQQRPRIDEYDDYLFALLYGVVGTEAFEEFRQLKLAVFCGGRFLVTVHQDSLKTIATLRARLRRRAEQVFDNGVDGLMCLIIDMMVDNYIAAAEHYETELEELEERSLSSSADDSIIEEASRLRSELLKIRRVAMVQRELLDPLAQGEYDYVSEDLGRKFAHVRDHMAAALDSIDAMRERLQGSLNNYHMTLSSRTNDIMRTLTVFATIILPLSLVAGIYGMNVPLWPPTDAPQSFWAILVVMAGVAAVLLVLFRRRRWI